MKLLDALKSRAGTVVLIDDHFAPPSVAHADEEDRTKFYVHLRDNAEANERVAGWLNLEEIPSPDVLMQSVDKKLSELWGLYLADEDAYSELAILFLTLKAEYEGKRQKLEILVEFCKSKLGVEPLIHSDITAAKEALSNCMIAFVDFYLKAGINNYQDAIAEHAQCRREYQTRFSHDDVLWPKVVFLVSSKLPLSEQLQAFREATGIRSAFFMALSKGDVSSEKLDEMVKPWSTTYGSTSNLNRYLDALAKAMEDAAAALGKEIDRLELHDLRMLDVLKLSAGNEAVQPYLTWILSEALASKLRATPALQSALLPKAEEMPFLDGKLLPQSVLFELFSDIAVSTNFSEVSKPDFGDIFQIEGSPEGEPQRLLLVISPACDLVRCSVDDEVLCTKGSVTKSDPDLSALLGKKALFGKGNHVIRYKDKVKPGYAHISWTLKKGLVTVPVSKLINEKNFKKIARLSEVFAQEVKDLALADASRVGTPVEPNFAVAGNVLVRARFGMGKDQAELALEIDLKDKPFISAIVTKGRLDPEDSNLPEIIVFTRQFADWTKTDFLPKLIGKAKVPAKLEKVVTYLGEWTDWHVPLDRNRAASFFETALSFKVVSKTGDLPTIGSNRLEILVTTE